MLKDNFRYFFVQELNENELKEKSGGQYFKPSIDGSFLTDPSDDKSIVMRTRRSKLKPK